MGSVGRTYRVAVVGPDGFPFVQEITNALKWRLDELAGDTLAEAQVDTFPYNIYDQESEVLRLAQELPAQGYDVIVSISSASCTMTLADACQGTETAVVYADISKSDSAGLASLNGVTGVTDIDAQSILDAIQTLTPDADTIGILSVQDNPIERAVAEQLRECLEENGYQYTWEEMLSSNDLIDSLEGLISGGADVIFTPFGDKTDISWEIAVICDDSSIPLYTTNEYMFSAGAMSLITLDNAAVGEQTAEMVFQILQGEELPAPQPAQEEIYVYRPVFERLGLTIDENADVSMLMRIPDSLVSDAE